MPAVSPDAFAVVLAPVDEVIVDGEAMLTEPLAEPQEAFEFVVDKQKTTDTFVPG